jgi:hypothetical protein
MIEKLKQKIENYINLHKGTLIELHRGRLREHSVAKKKNFSHGRKKKKRQQTVDE